MVTLLERGRAGTRVHVCLTPTLSLGKSVTSLILPILQTRKQVLVSQMLTSSLTECTEKANVA